MRKVGFIVNPIAGMGGRVGLKGTDGELILRKAIALGAKPIAEDRGARFLRRFKKLLKAEEREGVLFLTASGKMGENCLKNVGGFKFSVIEKVGEDTTAQDTIRTARKLVLENVEIIVFVGGDGTARDVHSAVDQKVPVIGVPSGVKVYSSVFGITPEATAELLKCFLDKACSTRLAEVVDIDEEAYRQGRLDIRLYGYLKTPFRPLLLQQSKESIPLTEEEEENRRAIARYFVEELMEENVIYILGPGSTTATIAKELGVEKTLLGVDVLLNGKIILKDANEKQLLALLSKYGLPAKIVISPLGREGFLLGRGNQQISPEVVRKVGLDNIIVIATHQKLKETPVLFVDTGDERIDREFLKRKYLKVLTDYNEFTLVKVETLV